MSARHKGLAHVLRTQFVADGTLSKDSYRAFLRLMEVRELGDYEILFQPSKAEVELLVLLAERFLSEVSRRIAG